MVRTRRRIATVTVCLLALLGAATGCDSKPATSARSAAGSAARTSPAAPSSSSPSGPTPSAAPAPPTCAATTFATLTPEQRAGQLIMVALQPGQQGSVAQLITTSHVGSVYLLGGWYGAATVKAAIASVDQSATPAATGGVQLWTAVDQEGGQVQQLKGPGFGSLPDALTQGTLPPAELAGQVQAVGAELAAAGIDIDLAPVADVVPTSIGTANAPIGKFHRQYGATAAQATPSILAFIEGMTAAGVLPTVKHFPGIGRISQNTDDSAVGISDGQLTADDPSLGTFTAAINHGVPLVMVSSALYPQLDPVNQAMFSPAIVTGLLRGKFGFGGVVISDDVGAAKAVAAVPVADRATRFIAAGGDVVLTAVPSQAPAMISALLAGGAADPAFQAKVDAAVMRVLEAKDRQKLLPCSG